MAGRPRRGGQSRRPKTFNANGVSADGTVVVGVLDNNQSYLARATSGLIDLAQFNRSLAANAGVAGLGLREADLALHGAHGSPLRGLPARGRQNVWLAGDWGRGDRSADSGSVAAGEFGYSRGWPTAWSSGPPSAAATATGQRPSAAKPAPRAPTCCRS